jgi:hypothetical protein
LSFSKPEPNRLKNRYTTIAHKNALPPSFMITPATC